MTPQPLLDTSFGLTAKMAGRQPTTGLKRSGRNSSAGLEAMRGSYFTALIFSSAPFGHSLAYLSRYFFWANVRKAFWSGV